MNPWKHSIQAILDLLRQGVTPERIAWSVILGAAVGVIPVLGVTTLLCTALALALRLNLVAIQAANWLVYPAQIALLIPFYRAGEWAFGAERLALMPADIIALFQESFWGAIHALWDTTLRAVVVWGVASLIASPLLYAALVPLLRRVMRRQQVREAPA